MTRLRTFETIVVVGVAFACAVLVLTGPACVEDLDPDYLLTTPRILAMRSEPTGLVRGAEPASLSVLMYRGPDEESAYAWSWCAEVGTDEDPFSCTKTADDVAGELGMTSIDDAIAGGASVDFPYPLDGDALDAACPPQGPGPPQDAVASTDAGEDDAGDVDAGPRPDACADPLWIVVRLVVDAQDGSKKALQGLRLYNTVPDELNGNPALDAVSVVGSAGAATASVTYGSTVTLLASIPANGLEQVERPVFPDDGGPPTLATFREGYTISWYVELGTLSSSTTTSAPLQLDAGVVDAGSESGLSVSWTLPADGPERSGTIIAVLRDQRGGVAWFATSVDVRSP